MSILKREIGETVVEGMKAADGLFSSKEEMATQYTARHSSDMSSDSWLSKNVRPMYLIGTWLLVATMIAAMSFGVVFDPVTFTAVVGMASVASGWYFSERSSMKNQRELIKLYKRENNK